MSGAVASKGNQGKQGGTLEADDTGRAALWTELILILLAVAGSYAIARHATPFQSGWTLALLMLFLLALAPVKRAIVLPLGAIRHWRRLHLAVGWLALGIFFAHLESLAPEGLLERLLAWLWLIMVTAGIVADQMARWIPTWITRRGGEEIPLQEIDRHRHHLLQEADARVTALVEGHGADALQHFHLNRLRPFLAHKEAGLHQLVRPGSRRDALLNALDQLRRSLDAEQAEILPDLAKIIEKKDHLDARETLGRLLTGWLPWHLPTAWGLLLLVLLHLVAVYGFQTG